MFVVLFLFLFAPCGHSLSCDLAINKVIVYLCITNFKETKEHPCTEILCLLTHVIRRWLQLKQAKVLQLFSKNLKNWFYLYLYSG